SCFFYLRLAVCDIYIHVYAPPQLVGDVLMQRGFVTMLMGYQSFRFVPLLDGSYCPTCHALVIADHGKLLLNFVSVRMEYCYHRIVVSNRQLYDLRILFAISAQVLCGWLLDQDSF